MLPDMQAAELNEAFRVNLRNRRKELGLTQAEVADRINAKRKRSDAKVHTPYISDLEKGVRDPYLGTIAEFAEALETTPDALIQPLEKIPA